MIAGAVVAAMTVLMAATPAEAADPVAALKAKLGPGKGIRFTDATSGDGKFSTETRYTGWGSRVRISAPPKSETAG
jgi:hypothetical protein